MDLSNLWVAGNVFTGTSSSAPVLVSADRGKVSHLDVRTVVNLSGTDNTAVSGSAVVFSGSTCSYCNSHGNDDAVLVGDTSIQVAPGYVQTSGTPQAWDFTLGAGSALIDAGDPSLLDADGSTSDIGGFGGPDANW